MAHKLHACDVISCLGVLAAVALAIVILVKLDKKEGYSHYTKDGRRLGGDSNLSHLRPDQYYM